MIPARFEHRANYDHIALVLAAKLKRRTDRNLLDSGFTVQRGEVGRADLA